MKTRFLASVLFVLILAGGYTKNVEIRPGVFISSDPADFPFPASGYTVYFVGESHGNHETKLVFLAYLKKFYKEAGLRDVILEEDRAYETDTNAYCHGLTDELPDGLCLRADILGHIREFNLQLPDNEKVTVHLSRLPKFMSYPAKEKPIKLLVEQAISYRRGMTKILNTYLVDVDSPLAIGYKHLIELHSRLGSAGEGVKIPEFSEFETWGSKPLYDLIDRLRNVSADRPDVLNGLDTVHLSLRWYFLGNRMDTGWPTVSRRTYAPIREDVITKNVEYVLSQLDSRPVLAFFGLFHGMKLHADPKPPVEGFKSWI